MSLFSIINELKANSSLNKKIQILQENKNNDDLKYFFQYTLNPLFRYGVKKIPEYEPIVLSSITFNDCIQLLDNLNNRKYTGNAAISKVQDLLNHCDYEMSELFIMMLSRTIRCGCSYTLIDMIWPDILPSEIKLCKAQAYSASNLENIQYPAYSQRKCDGARCLAIKKNGEIKFYSSGYKEYTGLSELKIETDKISSDDFVLDGELLVVDENNNVLSRKLGNGILNKSIHNTISKEEASNVRFVVWDYIPYIEYLNEKPVYNYKQVINFLDTKISSKHLKRISFVETKIVQNFDEALEHFKYMLQRGEEGTILKNMNMRWENARSKNCVKFKIIIENTLEIVDTFEGNGKYENCLGGFICKSSDGKVSVRVGSGLSDEIRKSVWPVREQYIGKFAEIKSNGLIESAPGDYSLFLPRFESFREDKLKADSFMYIQMLSDGSKMLIK